MHSIFVNYRSGSHAVAVAALVERLGHHFGDEQVFLDLGMPPGAEYPRHLDERLRRCGVLVVVVHDGWTGTWRPAPAKDWVHFEIVTALVAGIPIVPVLLEDTEPPARDELPADIVALADRQGARVRAASFRDDVDRLARMLEPHVSPDTAPPRETVGPKRRRVGLRAAAWAVALFLLTPVVLFEPGPLWSLFAFPAFASMVILLLMSVVVTTSMFFLKEVFRRWEDKAGRLTYREELSRKWILPALTLVAVAYGWSESMTSDGAWDRWEAWYLVVLALGTAFVSHRWWRRHTAEDVAWPPPVTTEHRVFRRAALRLRDELTTNREWRRPRSLTRQRQAVSIYLELSRVRVDLGVRAAAPLARWVRTGYSGEPSAYLGWFASIVALNLAAASSLVLTDVGGAGPWRLIALTTGLAAAGTALAVVGEFRRDRGDATRWVAELTDWQSRLGPLVLCSAAAACVQCGQRENR